MILQYQNNEENNMNLKLNLKRRESGSNLLFMRLRNSDYK